MKPLHILIVAAVTAWPALAPAFDASSAVERPKIGLALSGGGARGSAHIGVLQVLEEMDVPVDYIAGTSMGAIIGGMYAAGYEVAEIREILLTMDWEWAMTDRPARSDRTMRSKELEAQFMIPHRVGINKGSVQLPLGLVEGQHLDQEFHEIFMPVANVRAFSSLPIPFRAVATDLVTGEEVVLAEGSLPDSVRASMSVPGVFAPVEIDGRLLVDGGMANNLPVSVVREMGADIVIAVDISMPLLQKDQLDSVVSVTEQLTNFLTRRTTQAQMEMMHPDDVLIVPDLAGYDSSDFNAAAEIIELGFVAAAAETTRLGALSDAGHARPQNPGGKADEVYVAHFVEMENGSVLHDDIIRSRLSLEPGQPVDFKQLDREMDHIYSLDLFSSVTYDLVLNETGETGVAVKARPREWGPNYMQFGLELSSDFAGNSDFKLGAAYTRNALNHLGGELRLTGSMGREDEISFEFYQPVDRQARWYVQPELYWTRENYRVWQEDQNVSELEIAGWGTALNLGRNFSTTDRLRFRYEFGRGEVDTLVGIPWPGPQVDIDIGELSLQYMHDSLDSIWFPTSGTLHRLEYLYADDALGARLDYRQADASGSVVFTAGKNTALLNYELGYSFDDAAPVERWYRLGGFGRLSGLQPDRLLGRHVALATLAYYRRLNKLDIVSAYAGVTLEAGNTWDYRDDIGLDDLRYSGSAFLGMNSPLGPIYFAVGYSDSDDVAAYFYLGNPFRVRRFD